MIGTVSATSSQSDSSDISASRISIPVAVMLNKRIIDGGFWQQESWALDSVLVGKHLAVGDAEHQGTETARGADGTLLLWSGYSVTLFRDACERYWHALIGDKPLVYVVTRESDDDEATHSSEPALVTVDYDEALAHCETDGCVLSCEIPAELYRLMEQFVLQHYRPQKFKKRRRKNWSENASDAPAGGQHTSEADHG